jgi:hypothetical protein
MRLSGFTSPLANLPGKQPVEITVEDRHACTSPH